MSAQDGGPAYPVPWEYADNETGMSLRQYAAIKLRVPDSGTDWLDAMIREGRRMDYAGQALAGMLSDPNAQGNFYAAFADESYRMADAMIAARGSK